MICIPNNHHSKNVLIFILKTAWNQVLYMFAWFRSSGEILRENIVSSAELFERSIQVSDCQPENECRGVDGDEAIGLGGLKTSDSKAKNGDFDGFGRDFE